MGTSPSESGLVRRLRGQRAHHRSRPRVVRALYVLVGLTLTLGGMAMLVLPGPAFVVIPIGLAVLSLEFTWAQRALDHAIEQGEAARRRAARTSPIQRALAGAAVALAAAAFVTWALIGDVPLLPV